MSKNKKTLLVLVMLVALAGYFSYTKIEGESYKAAAQKDETTSFTVKSMSIGESIDTTGRVKAHSEVDITSKISSDEIRLNVQIGDYVKAGDLLATLDKSDIEVQILSKKQAILEAESNLASLKKEGNLSYENSYDNTKALYNNKKKTYDNNLLLYSASSISQIELNNSKTDMEKAYNDYQDAKNRYEAFDIETEIKILGTSLEILKKNLEFLDHDLDKTSIIAPFDSVVTEIYVENGDTVREDLEIMHLMDTSKLMVELEVSEYEVYKIIEGQDVIISPYGNSEKTYKGLVRKIYPSGSKDDDQSYVKVDIEVIDSDERLKPGFSVTLNIQISYKEEALVVPYDALNKTNRGQMLTKINEDASKTNILVETGIESDLFIEIISDEISEGDSVLVMSNIDFSSQKDAMKLPGVGIRPEGGGNRGK